MRAFVSWTCVSRARTCLQYPRKFGKIERHRKQISTLSRVSSLARKYRFQVSVR